MFDKILTALRASIRDVVLAGVAAGAGVLIAAEMPTSTREAKALLVAAVYAALRAAVAFAVALLQR